MPTGESRFLGGVYISRSAHIWSGVQVWRPTLQQFSASHHDTQGCVFHIGKLFWAYYLPVSQRFSALPGPPLRLLGHWGRGDGGSSLALNFLLAVLRLA